MFKKAKPLFLIVETPLHAGSGNDLGIVDLPIQREKHTDLPKIEASGLKGSLREVFESYGRYNKIPSKLINSFRGLESNNYFEEGIKPTFGPDDGELHAGALGFTDARLLLFSIKSVKGVFAWITCPLILKRFQEDLKIAEILLEEFKNIDKLEWTIPQESKLIVKNNQIVLEEYTISVKQDDGCTKIAEWFSKNILPAGSEYDFWREKMKKDMVILSDDMFKDFVTLSTEIIARTKISDETGTVDKKSGGLWYEEYLPTDSILYSLVLATPVFIKKPGLLKTEDDVMRFFENGLSEIVQIGGNATLGKGLVRTKLL